MSSLQAETVAEKEFPPVPPLWISMLVTSSLSSGGQVIPLAQEWWILTLRARQSRGQGIWMIGQASAAKRSIPSQHPQAVAAIAPPSDMSTSRHLAVTAHCDLPLDLVAFRFTWVPYHMGEAPLQSTARDPAICRCVI